MSMEQTEILRRAMLWQESQERQGNAMNIFVTLDQNYLSPLQVMLTSLFINNAEESFDIWAAGDGFTEENWKSVEKICRHFKHTLHRVEVPQDAFARAPVIRYYSRAMYYRLLAAQLLPESLDRVLYLDPDILIINSIRPLYDLPMDDALYAAATHEGLTGVSSQIAKIRLSTPDGKAYFNSGVLLMNLEKMREEVDPEKVFQYADQKRSTLILPDQDILNGLFWSRIKLIEESIWNYDARKYQSYMISSQNEMTVDWVMQNTAVLHFCGKGKPWKDHYRGKFSALYKHYSVFAQRVQNR